MSPWAHGPMIPWAHGPKDPWALGPMGPSWAWIDPGSVQDRSRIDPWRVPLSCGPFDKQ